MAQAMMTSEAEASRLEALRDLRILDTERDDAFDRITKLAAHVCNAPMAMVALQDERRHWLKSAFGFDFDELPCDTAFCSFTIRSNSVFVVRDALRDARFADSPLVVGAPHIRAFAGAPLIADGGHALGALCVAHTTPTPLSDAQLEQLVNLAAIVVETMTARRDRRLLEMKRRLLRAILSVQQNFIIGAGERREAFDHLLDAALDFTGSSCGFVRETDSQGRGVGVLAVRTASGAPCDSHALEPLIEATAASRDILVINEQANDSADASGASPPPFTSFIGVPLRVGDELVGVLGLANHACECDAHFIDSGRALFSAMANMIMADRADRARRDAEADMHAAKESAIEASVAKSLFLANTSHEIRTPLNGVLGMAAALEKTTLAPKQRDMLRVITQSGAALSQILNDILDLSKIEAGRLELEFTTFELDEFVDSLGALYALKAEQKGLAFEIEIDPSAHGSYLSDPTRIRQILGNLIDNAIKFTSEGRVTVHVARDDDREDGFTALVFTVSDTGVGVDAETLPHLFDSFVQADPSITRNHGGSGLGLTIARQLCEKMGGSITAQSTPGEGSEFRFHVLAEAGDAAAPAAEVDPDAAANDVAALRILLVEDHPTNQLVAQTLLEPLGAEIALVENGRDAVEAWSVDRFDIVLMDIQMPVMDGVEATVEIRRREIEENRPRTPIVAVTANAMAHQIAEYLDVGMDACVTKPINPKKLYEAIFTHVSRDDARRQNSA